MRDIHYKIKPIRLADREYSEANELRKLMGVTWNMFFRSLIAQAKKTPYSLVYFIGEAKPRRKKAIAK